PLLVLYSARRRFLLFSSLLRLPPRSPLFPYTTLFRSTAGVASLVGPLLGGVLVDGPGWQWIFFVNVPVGALALVLVARNVPRFRSEEHTSELQSRFDLVCRLLLEKKKKHVRQAHRAVQ